MEVPAPFAPAPAFADANDTQAIVEFLPPGETIEVWSQMLTLTAFVDTSGQTAEQAVDAMANHLASGYGGACPDSFAAEDLGSPAVPGAEAALAGWLGCGTVGGGPSEAMVVLVLAAGGKIMTVQWAERGPGSADPMAFDMNQWLPRLDVLMGFQL